MSEKASTARENRLGLTKSDYQGPPSTMCKGCGHDRISEAITQAAFRLGLESHRVVKMSGIGCSSKTPAYFLGRAYGLNGTHGRMPSFSTGAHVANHELIPIGVSGDGDTASIGIGQFVHLARRNSRMVYIVENNGIYGLTKGQFSATADLDSPSRRGIFPTEGPIDLCGLALELGCSLVARSFSGDKKQLIPLLQAALSFDGFAFLDVISPCVTFNNHEASTKSYTYQKGHSVFFHDPTFVPVFEHIDIDYGEGEDREVKMHDGSTLLLRKLEQDYDPHDRAGAFSTLAETRSRGEVLTGLIYVNTEVKTLLKNLELTDTPLARLEGERLRPPPEALDELNRSFRV
ncbi:MAG: 2-oxoacid:ferredoxin oxidoreductase subunit beta [Planctomycetota bacterium]